MREPRVNGHVSRLNRFLPFSTAHDQIFEEYQTDSDSLDLKTAAIAYAKDAIAAGARLIVLTGDAGHGKTHMCRRIIVEYLGLDSRVARERLLDSCDGSVSIRGSSDDVRRLRIHKDLSEVHPPANAARLLEDADEASDETLLVCANEGRLRAIISSSAAGPVCSRIAALFQNSFRDGVSATQDRLIHIINLNFQSVAAPGEEEKGSLIRRTLHDWVGNASRWNKSCSSCSAEGTCPIRHNRELLAEGPLSTTRLERLEELFEVVERLGHVITIREMLMLVAYLITGGLTCEDVHSMLRRQETTSGWQHSWAFYNLLFHAAPGASEDRIYKGIPILNAFRRIDPGCIASRKVDEPVLHRGEVFNEGQLDLQFAIRRSGQWVIVDAAAGIDEFIGNPQTKAEHNREAAVTGIAVAALRRKIFFEDNTAGSTVMARLGFRYGDQFLALLEDRLDKPGQVRLKNTFISGLHALQGLRIEHSETTLQLVDPAFGRASADAAIIAARIPGSQISLIPARKAWKTSDDQWTLPRSVDWTDRTVALRVDDKTGDLHYLHLDLLAFECVARAASGYVSEEFYANEIRRIRTFLGNLAERGRIQDGQISVFMDGKIQSISIDMDVIHVGGA